MRKKSASIKRKKRGFTLVELLLVMAIIGIISSISILSLISFQRHQRLVNAARDVNTTLNLAKSRSQSQVKPQYCVDNNLQLTGYRVTLIPQSSSICTSGTCVQLTPVCNGSEILSLRVVKNLPSGIGVSGTGGATTFLFNVLSGNVTYANTNPSTDLTFTYGTDTMKITIYRDGRVSLNE